MEQDFSRAVPLSKEAPLAKLTKLVPSFDVRVTLRLDAGFTCSFLQTAASEGTRDAKDSGTSQSYTLG